MPGCPGLFLAIAAAAAAKIESGVAGGACPGSVSAPEGVRTAGPDSDCFEAAGIVGGQRSEAARRGNRRIGWEGEAPAVKRSGTSVGARGGARHKKGSRVL